jgi:putative transcription factor
MCAYVDRFQDHRVFKKASSVPDGPPRPPPGPKPDSSARKMMEIENETERFQVETTDISFANRLKTLRAQKEMSQKDLAQRASVKINIIQDYENGKGMPDGKLIARLEQILGGPLRDRGPKKK